MADFAQLQSVTSILGARTSKTFMLTWLYPDAPTPTIDYTKVKIFRYIGSKYSCSTPTLEATGMYPNPDGSDVTGWVISSNILSTTTFTDDLSSYDNTSSTTLKSRHGITDADNDRQIIHEILYSQRSIHYFIQSFKESSTAAFDSLPYVVAAYTFTRRIEAHAAKSQVRHDLFNFEGDMRWSTWVPNATNGTVGGLSRTSVDLNIFRRKGGKQTGTYGRGGYVWASDRLTGNVFRFNLSNGLQTARYATLHRTRGLGISVDPNTGDCYVGVNNGTGAPIGVYKCEARHSNVDTDNTTFFPLFPVAVNIVSPATFSYFYGFTPIPGQSNVYAISTFTSKLLAFNQSSQRVIQIRQYTGDPTNYGITAGPDGWVWHGLIAQGKIEGINFNNYGSTTTISNIGAAASITVDLPGLTPNSDTQYGIWSTKGPGTGISTASRITRTLRTIGGSVGSPNTNAASWQYCPALNTALYPNAPQVGNVVEARGVGVDSENNIWAAGTFLGKHYQIPTGTTYPYGGTSIYPSIPLSAWPAVTHSSREIEWFFTRDGHNGDILEGTVEANLGSAFRYVPFAAPTKTVTSASTLQNTVAVNWYPARTETAHAAYQAIVTGAVGAGSVDRKSSNYNSLQDLFLDGGWSPRFENGKVSARTRVWGKRLYEPRPDNLTQHQINRVAAVNLVKAWEAAFANWDTAYVGNPSRGTYIVQNQKGLQIYPHFSITQGLAGSFENCVTFLANRGYSYQYSDFTGNILASVNKDTEEFTYFSQIAPSTASTTAKIGILNARQTSPLSESTVVYFWDDILFGSAVSNFTGYESVTGYDNLTIDYYVSAQPGSFVISSWNVSYGDYTNDYGGITNVVTETVNVNPIPVYTGDYVDTNTFIHTYHDTTKVGLTGSITLDARQTNGVFEISATAETNLDPYNCGSVNSETGIVSTTVLERWPEPGVYINHESLSAARLNWLPPGCNHPWGADSRFEKETDAQFGYSQTNIFTNNVTAFGVDPVSAVLFDRSIARTYPLLTWVASISTNNIWSEAIQLWNSTGSTAYPYTTTVVIDAAALGISVPQDSFSSFGVRIYDRTYRYGIYNFTLNVNASTTLTSGADPYSQIATVSQTLNVAEFEPFANFWAVSGWTVPDTYIDETRTVQASDVLVEINPIPNGSSNFVSGYAPNLTVWFLDSSMAHTFPISSYDWNFGDYYDETKNTLQWLTTSNSGTFDSGCWTMNLSSGSHIAAHTYVMPGFYDVTLTVKASTTGTVDTCARYVDSSDPSFPNFYVYVEEIPPQCCFAVGSAIEDKWSISALTGTSPFTVYAHASCITAGSFPICRIDYDWGDGSAIETITRSPFLTTSNLGTVLTAISTVYSDVFTMPFSSDVTDPRNYITAHTYDITTPGGVTLAPVMCAYACNTNTKSVCTSSTEIQIVPLTEILTETRHLIGSRYTNKENDLVYVFESEDRKSTYYVGLSSTITE